MASRLLKSLIAFCVGFGIGSIATLLNGEFVIHIPIVLGIFALALYVTKEKWWSFWI